MGLFGALRGLLAGRRGREERDSSEAAPCDRGLTRPAPPASLSREGSGKGIARADGVDWVEVRRVYEEGEVPLKAIQARFKISRRRLRQAYLEGGWRLRPQIATPGPRQGQRPKTAKLRPRPGQRRHDARNVSRRLLRLAGERLAQLEEAAAGRAAAQPTAEELKAMAELARALPALMREDRLLGGAGGEAAESEAERTAAEERQRQEAERARKEEMRKADVAYMRAELKRQVGVLMDNFLWHHERGEGEAFLAGLRDVERKLLMTVCDARPEAKENCGEAMAN